MKPNQSRWLTTLIMLPLAIGVFLGPVTPTAAEPPITEWRVWMKMTPCSSSRADWVTAAERDPTTGAGGAHFVTYPGSHAWGTLAEAMSEAILLRNALGTFGSGETPLQPKYSSYCCPNYRVFKNMETGKYSIVVGAQGSPGNNFTQEGGLMCCEDAAATAGFPASYCGGGGGGTNPCFPNDSGMASTNRDDHYNWAQQHDPAEVEANLKDKINLLFSCPSVSDDQLTSAFADYSIVIAKYVQDVGCFGGDSGVTNTDWSAHKQWAREKDRAALLNNLQWKMGTAFKCLSRAGQSSLFADSSVVTGRTPLAVSGTSRSGSPGLTQPSPPPTSPIPSATPSGPQPPAGKAWVCDGPVVTNGKGETNWDAKVQAGATQFTFTLESEGKPGSNTITWTAPPLGLGEGQEVTISINSTANPFPYLAGIIHSNCAAKASGDDSASTSAGGRGNSPHAATYKFIFTPDTASSVGPNIQISAGYQGEGSSPTNSALITWRYHKVP